MTPRGGARTGTGPKRKDPQGLAKMASFRLPPSTIELIKGGAEALGLSQAALIDAAIRAYLDTHPGPSAQD